MNECTSTTISSTKPTTTTRYNSDYESYNKIIVYDDDEDDYTIGDEIFYKETKKNYIEKSFTTPNIASILNNNDFEAKNKFDDDDYNNGRLNNNSIDANKVFFFLLFFNYYSY